VAGPQGFRILVVDDDSQYGELVHDYLTDAGHTVDVALTAEEGLTRVQAGGLDVVLLDLSMPHMDGLSFLRRLPPGDRPEIVVLSGLITVSSAVEAVKLGAADCLSKGDHLETVELTVRRAAEARRRAREPHAAINGAGQQVLGAASILITRSPRMLEILSVLERVASSNIAVLLTGESGTGKDLLARTIHRLSPRSAGPFVDVNCAALSESLLEAELFGHEKGAFTGATSTRPGLAEAADGGTLFLDEVAEMPPALQAKLLRMTEDRTLYRVGGRQRIQVDIRIVAATNRDLPQEIAAGRLREDLYYRLAGVEITVPPLRERAEDVEPLAQHYLRTAVARAGRGPTSLSLAAMTVLQSHRWPGNVRELRNAMERLALLVRGDVVDLEHLTLALPGRLFAEGGGTPAPAPAESSPSEPSLKELERARITHVLNEEDWHHSRAAQRLGMPLRTLYRRIKAYNLARPAHSEHT
jgi:two-component system, NtrC family, response regulator AtoC